jgi:hypothetical protein
MVGGFYSAVHDTLWFGTSLGRVFRSTDKGHHWTVSAPVSLSGKQVKPRFRNGFHGLLLDYSTGTGQLCETFDGGTTWTPIDYTGPREGDDIVWVPGTPNTWVKSSLIVGTTVCAYSFDGGHTWSDFIGTSGSPFAQMAWINDHCGWSGGVNTGATQNGVHKFVGSLAQLPSPQNVQATAVNHHVDISWNAPAYDPATMSLQGYSISRNGTLLNQALVSGLAYTDPDVSSGHYTYCVAAQYNMGASQGTCKTVDVAVGIVSTDEQPELMIYPNPAHQSVTIKSSGIIREITVYDQMGHALNVAIKSLSKDFSAVDVSDLAAGIYVVSIRSASWISKAKLVVY